MILSIIYGSHNPDTFLHPHKCNIIWRVCSLGNTYTKKNYLVWNVKIIVTFPTKVREGWQTRKSVISISIYQRGDHLNVDIFGYSLLHKAGVTGGDIPPIPSCSESSGSGILRSVFVDTSVDHYTDTRHQTPGNTNICTGLSVLTTHTLLHIAPWHSRQQAAKDCKNNMTD